MRRFFRTCTYLSVIAAALALGSAAAAPEPRTRLILISVDGLLPSTYTSSAGSPVLRRFAARGAWASAVRGVWPTNTKPSHTSLITGVQPGVHGIVNNFPVDPARDVNAPFGWYARDVKVPTLVSAAKTAGLSTAVVMWPVSVGLGADYLVPTFNWQRPSDGNLMRALSTPHLIDEFERDGGVPYAWPPTDEQRIDLAAFLLRAHRPDLLLLYIGTLDAFEHTYGTDAPMTASALRDIDRLLERFLAVVATQPYPGDTYIAVVSDHGYIDVTHAVGPNTLFKQEGLIDTDARGVIREWRAVSQGTGGSSLVYVADPSDAALVARVRTLLDTFAGEDRAGIDRVLDRDELVAAGADPDAAFGLAMRPGYSLIEDTDRLYGRPYIKAMHGYPPTHPEMDASFMLAGPGLTGRGDIGTVRMTQIAPTLAGLLGIALSPAADSPIEAIRR